MEDPEEMLKRLYEMLSSQGKRRAPTTNNPNKYARAIKIDPSVETDDSRKERSEDLLMVLSRMEHLRRKLDDLTDEATICVHTMQAAKTEFFSKAHRIYPQVVTRNSGETGCGWREWRGDFYVVAWDDEESEEGGSDGTLDKGHGNYI